MRKPEDLHETGQPRRRVIDIGGRANLYFCAGKTDCGIFAAVRFFRCQGQVIIYNGKLHFMAAIEALMQ